MFMVDSNALFVDGEFVHSRCIIRDITELKQAQRAQASLAAIVESSDDAIVGKSLQGIVQTWNDAAERIFGYTADEAIGRHISFLIPPERISEEDEIMRRLRAGRRIDHFESIRVRSDGTRIPVSLTISPIKDEDGRIIGASKTARDITARKQSEQALRDSEQRLRIALEAGSMGTWEWSLETNSVVWSPGLEKIHGREPGSFTGDYRSSLDDVHPEDRERLEASISRSLETGEDHQIEYRILWPDGSTHWLEARGKVFFDEDATPKRMAGVCVDITERRRTEQALRDADRRKDEFLATLAHELRNPLAPICSGLELIKMLRHEPDKLEEVRGAMERQAQQLVVLVEDLLDVSRITRGKLQLRKSITALNDVLLSAVETSRPHIDKANHHLSLNVPDKALRIEADPHRLAQVISNLLNNAARFTPAGGRIFLGAEQDGCDVLISVRDTGIGIPADMQAAIFAMFAQGDQTTKDSQPGLGIGLTLVKSLVLMHGGDIGVRSEGAGKGSEFRVRLPIVVDSSPHSADENYLAEEPELPGCAPRAGRRR